jgi:hypothetical protein
MESTSTNDAKSEVDTGETLFRQALNLYRTSGDVTPISTIAKQLKSMQNTKGTEKFRNWILLTFAEDINAFFEAFGRKLIQAKFDVDGKLHTARIEPCKVYSNLEDEYKLVYNSECFIFGTGAPVPFLVAFDFKYTIHCSVSV